MELVLFAAIVYGWRHRGDPLTRFALAAMTGPWIMFEIFQTKLVHYMLPIFPPLALLTARAIAREAALVDNNDRNSHVLRATKRFLVYSARGADGRTDDARAGAVHAVQAAKQPDADLRRHRDRAVGAELCRATFVAWRARRPFYAAAAIGVGMLAIVGVLYGYGCLNVPAIHTSQRVAAALCGEGATNPGSVIMIDYKEPSLAFYQGGTIREESNNSYLAQTDPLLWPRWIVITRADLG